MNATWTQIIQRLNKTPTKHVVSYPKNLNLNLIFSINAMPSKQAMIKIHKTLSNDESRVGYDNSIFEEKFIFSSLEFF